MSTKIYEAYRVPQNKLKEFRDILFSQYKTQTKERIKQIIENIKIDDFFDYAPEKIGKDDASQDTLTFVFTEWLVEVLFVPSSKSLEKSLFRIDYGFLAFPHGRYFYIIPDKPEWLWYSLLSTNLAHLDYVQDFSYWNNSDKPDGVSTREWNGRKKMWDEIYDDSVKMYVTGLDGKSRWDVFELVTEVINEL